MPGCIGSFWCATNGLLQGDPLSVVILNCVLCPLVTRLSSIGDLSLYAFADDLTVVSTSWDTLMAAYTTLCQFSASTDLLLNLTKCQLWNKGNPYGHHPPDFDQFTFCFYPFLIGSPIDIGVPYDDSLSKMDSAVLLRAKRIAIQYYLCHMLFFIDFSLPLSRHVTIIMPFHVIWAHHRIALLNMLLLQSLYLKGVVGSVARLFFLWFPPDTFFPLIFSSTIVTSLSIFCMLNRPPQISEPIYHKYGLLLSTLNGALFLVYVPLLNTSVSYLKTLLFSMSTTTRIRLTTIFIYLYHTGLLSTILLS